MNWFCAVNRRLAGIRKPKPTTPGVSKALLISVAALLRADSDVTYGSPRSPRARTRWAAEAEEEEEEEEEEDDNLGRDPSSRPACIERASAVGV